MPEPPAMPRTPANRGKTISCGTLFEFVNGFAQKRVSGIPKAGEVSPKSGYVTHAKPSPTADNHKSEAPRLRDSARSPHRSARCEPVRRCAAAVRAPSLLLMRARTALPRFRPNHRRACQLIALLRRAAAGSTS